MNEQRDWGGLRGIIDEARDIARDERERPLVDCPVCGTTLQKNERLQQLGCPLGHFRAPAGARRADYA